MSLKYVLSCGECDEKVVFSEKHKKYVHADRGRKFDHEVEDVLSERVA